MFPATTQTSKDTPRKEDKGSLLDESVQGCPSKKEGERKERGGKTRKWTGVPSYEQASRDTLRRGVYLSVTFRNATKAKREEGEGEG